MFSTSIRILYVNFIAAVWVVQACAQPHSPGTVPYFLSEPFSIGGQFSGVGIQNDGQKWQVSLFDEPFGMKLEYPDLQCGGTPEIISSSSDWMLLKEKLTYGHKNCIDGGLVLIRYRDKRSVDYIWCSGAQSSGAAVMLRDGLSKFSTQELLVLTQKAFPDAGASSEHAELCKIAKES